MGWLGCPLCCRQDFRSVAGLHDHLLYFTYRPLQCDVCGARLQGIHQLTRHLQEHIGEGLLGLHGATPPEPDPHKSGLTYQTSGPLSHTTGPISHTSCPTSHTIGPSPHIFSRIPHTSAPSLHTSGPIPHTSGPSLHTSDPSTHTSDLTHHTSDSTSHKAGPSSYTSSSASHTHDSFIQLSAPSLHKSGTFSHTSDPAPYKHDTIPLTSGSTPYPTGPTSHFPDTVPHTPIPSPYLSDSNHRTLFPPGAIPHISDLASGPTPHTPGPTLHTVSPSPHTVIHSPHSVNYSPHSVGPSPHTPGPTPHTPGLSSHTVGPSPHSVGPSPHTVGHSPHTPDPSSHSVGPSPHTPDPSLHSVGPSPHTPDPSLHTVGPSPQLPGSFHHKSGQASHVRVATSQPKDKMVVEKTSGREDQADTWGGSKSYGDTGSSNSTATIDNTRVAQEPIELVLCAYYCESCGEKVVGKDAYFSHIRWHSQEQDEEQSQSQFTQDKHSQFSPHSQSNSKYIHDSPHKFTSCSPHPKLSSPAGLSDAVSSPLVSVASTPGNITTDTETLNESADPPECLSDCRGESDAANQLLKLREWQLGKLGKNFRRHKISFGKSPGTSELSPMSVKVASVDSPSGSGDPGSVLDRRPPSQESFPSLIDGKPGSVDMYSLDQPSFSAEYVSSDVNPLSVGQSDLSFHHNSVDREPDREASTYGGPDSYSPAPSTSSADENLHNVSLFSVEEPDHSLQGAGYINSYADKSTDPSSPTPHRSVHQAQSFSPTARFGSITEQEVNTSAFQNKGLLPYPHLSPEQTEDTIMAVHNRLSVDTDISQTIAETFRKSYEVTELSVDTTFPGAFDNSASTTSHKPHPEICNVESSAFKPCMTQHQSVRYLELQSVPLTTMPSDSQNAQVDIHTEAPSNQSLARLHSGGSHTEGKLQNSVSLASSLTSPENTICANHNSTVANVDNLDATMSPTNKLNKIESTNERTLEQSMLKDCSQSNHNTTTDDSTQIMSGLQDLSIPGAAQGSDSSVQKSTDTMPYLHKKFHHDQDRKVILVSSQSADVSRYIHNYQSLLVNRLNGTLSANIPFTSNICPDQEISKKQERSTVGQSLKIQPQAPQYKEYMCEVCDEACAGRSAYKSHYRTHEVQGQNNFTCKYCGEKYNKKCTKDLHERRHRTKSVYRCEHCMKAFSKDYSLQRHKQEVHVAKKSFICAECSRGFSTERRLQEHIEVHQGEKKHKCSHCKHSCHTASGLRTHIMERHSGADGLRHSCDVCGEKFTKKYGLIRHKKRKHGAQQLSCELCPKKFSCNEDLLQHVKSHNNVNFLKCDNCEKTFTTSWALQRHAESHRPTHPQFKCKKCQMEFTRRDSLKIHLRIHAQKKPHVCHCGRKFVRKSQLREHSDSHSEVPRYTCKACQRAFKFKISLRNHSCSKSGERECVPESEEPVVSEEDATRSDKSEARSMDFAVREEGATGIEECTTHEISTTGNEEHIAWGKCSTENEEFTKKGEDETVRKKSAVHREKELKRLEEGSELGEHATGSREVRSGSATVTVWERCRTGSKEFAVNFEKGTTVRKVSAAPSEGHATISNWCTEENNQIVMAPEH